LGADLWIKRDDLTGFGLSGNKVRKLEFLFAAALDQGAKAVITCGGIQSNHCRATAVAARQLGLEPILLLRGEPGPAVGNYLLDQLLGARVHFCSDAEYSRERDAIMSALADRYRDFSPYIIPEGGSNGLGAFGYIEASRELGQRFDGVFCAVGSGGTLAGLALGEDVGPIDGVAVCDDRAFFESRVKEIAAEAQVLGAGPLSTPGERWRVLEGYQGSGYGIASPAVWEIIRVLASLEGIFLDPVYSAKAMHALVSEVRAGRRGGRLLFWHTGGTFGMMGRGEEVFPS
jgi:D-cysteine desulfhydrase